MKLQKKIVASALLLLAMPAFAADLAILQNGFSIRHERRETMGNVTRLYLDASPQSGYIDVPSDQIASFEHDDAVQPETDQQPAVAGQGTSLPGAALQGTSLQGTTIQDFANAAGAKHNVDPDLIQSVIRAESSFNPRAVSRKGAQGLMQLMPATAAKLGVTNSMDPAANVDGGTQYLHEMLERFNNDLVKALAAYNAGPERVEKYKGVPPYHETTAYVSRIISDFNRKKLAQFAAAQASTRRTAKKEKTSRPAAAVDHTTTAEAQAASE